MPRGEAWSFGAGVLFFLVSCIIGNVLSEVYGYAHALRMIWIGFAPLLFMAFTVAVVVVALPWRNDVREGGVRVRLRQ